jgi:hypothetical protein
VDLIDLRETERPTSGSSSGKCLCKVAVWDNVERVSNTGEQRARQEADRRKNAIVLPFRKAAAIVAHMCRDSEHFC